MKNLIIHGLLAGILASVASIIYLNIYQEAFGLDYSEIINIGSIIGSCMIGCILMTAAYAVLIHFKKAKLIGWLNVIIAVLSFASIIGPIGMSLPLTIEYPELFPGLVIPMHFFPALSFLSIYPLFSKKTNPI